LPLRIGDLDLHVIRGTLGPSAVHNPSGISISSAVFTGLTIVTDRPTDRQTDHATRSATTCRTYVVLR